MVRAIGPRNVSVLRRLMEMSFANAPAPDPHDWKWPSRFERLNPICHQIPAVRNEAIYGVETALCTLPILGDLSNGRDNAGRC